jgi:hypothetical protein
VPPLSEREQKILEEIERGLHDEDVLFASEDRRRPSRPRVVAGVATFLGGLALLIVFFATRLLPVGILAFGGMVAGIVLLASPVSALVTDTKDNAKDRGRTFKRSLSGWEEKLRNRYNRR